MIPYRLSKENLDRFRSCEDTQPRGLFATPWRFSDVPPGGTLSEWSRRPAQHRFVALTAAAAAIVLAVVLGIALKDGTVDPPSSNTRPAAEVGKQDNT